MPFNSRAVVVRLMAERYDTESKVKLGGFRSQLKASYVSSHIDELWYNKTVCLWMTIQYIYIYIYIYIQTNICIYIYIYLSVDEHIYMCVYIYIYMYMHEHTHTHTYIYIYIYNLCPSSKNLWQEIFILTPSFNNHQQNCPL